MLSHFLMITCALWLQNSKLFSFHFMSSKRSTYFCIFFCLEIKLKKTILSSNIQLLCVCVCVSLPPLPPPHPGDNMWQWATTCAVKPGIHCRRRQYVAMGDNMCHKTWHTLSPATIYARRQNMPQHGLFPLTGVVDGKHSDCVSHLLQVFSVDVTFCDFGSLVLHALFLAFYVFHGCRLLEVERGGNSGFGPPAHQALSWACGEALLRSVSEVQKARVLIGQGVGIAQWLAGAPDS